jgi:predicted amidophosphoribosyltransferase
VEVSDRHAEAINKGQFCQNGLVSATGAVSFGTKRGQRCDSCGRTWNAWNATCPKCGTETVTV